MRRLLLLVCLVPLCGLTAPVSDTMAGARLLTRAGEGALPEPAHAEQLGQDRVARYGAYGPDLVLLHGAHEGGIDEPRFVRLAEALAAEGLRVIAPELPGLKAFRLDPSDRAVIERVAPAGAALFGVSLGGGLALRAAADAPGRYRMVWTLGAHYDLREVVRHQLTDQGDPYAREVFTAAFGEAIERLGVDAFAGPFAEMSPRGLLQGLSTPVFALHGTADPLVPPEHSQQICAEAPHCVALVTPVLGHTEVTETSLGERIAVARFVGNALRATRRLP